MVVVRLFDHVLGASVTSAAEVVTVVVAVVAVDTR